MHWLVVALICGAAGEAPEVFFQAHRGGLDEAPENTMAAYEHAWGIPGAVPEMDLQTTLDGVVVMMHDDTPARTTDAPAPWRDLPVAKIPYSEIQQWDAGAWFGEKYRGAKVPTLDEVFDAMAKDSARQMYLDLKAVELDGLVKKIHERGYERRVIFVHGDAEMCKKLKGVYEGARTMTWLSGSANMQRKQFERLKAKGFPGISQLQFHLRVTPNPDPSVIEYEHDDAYLREAASAAHAAGVELQVRPFAFNHASLERLVGCGIHWYVADAPKAFYDALTGR